MKRFAAASLLTLGMAFSAITADFTNYITDTACANKQGAKAASEKHAACAAKCINGGSPAVLLTEEGKIYKIADQDKVKEHAGHKVTITGDLDGDTLKVESVKM